MEGKKIKLVYIGQCESDGRVLYCYVLAEDLDCSPLCFGKPLKSKQGRPGGMIECVCSVDEEGKIKDAGEGIYAGFLNDTARVSNWQLAHDAFRVSRKKLTERRRNVINEVLSGLRRTYQAALPSQRQSMLAYIIWFLTK